MLPPEAVIESELAAKLGVSVFVAIADAPIDPSRLSSGEKRRRDSLAHGPKHDSWLRGRAALKRLLSRLGERDDTAGIEFPSSRWSLTHSRDAAVAVGAGPGLEGIGVDLEIGCGPSARAARLFLAESERRDLADDDVAARRRFWTVKEALYKANPRNAETWFADYVVEDPGRKAGLAWLALEQRRIEFSYASLELAGGCLTVAICRS